MRASFDTPDSTVAGGRGDPAGRAQPHAGEPQGRQRAQGAGGRRAVHHLLARRPRADQRRAARAPRPARRHAGPARHRRGAGGGRDRARAAPAGGAVAPVRRAGQRGGDDDARGVGPAAGRRRQGARGGARAAGGRAHAARRRRLQPAGRRGGRRHGRAAATNAAGTATSSTRWRPSRTDDLRRGVNTVGPHRDDLVIVLDGREARTHASQGEQRCLALALRLGDPRAGAGADAGGADPPARRRVLRARPGAQPRPGGRAPGRPVDPHHGVAAARGDRGGPRRPGRDAGAR